MRRDFTNDVVIHKIKNNIHYLQFRKLLEYPELEHCYTMRLNGIDFRIYENDSILSATYDKICNSTDFVREAIVKPHQTHTDIVEKVENPKQNFSEVDGLITDKRNITLCTTSADCTSLLFYDPVKNVIADVHSGWRGTQKKIAKIATKKMNKEYNCNPEDLICAICPHIRVCHFEVSEDVKDLFYNTFSYMKDIDSMIKKGSSNGKYFVDTTKINIQMLRDAGVKPENILDSGICSVCNKDYFHSYRADKELSGRNGVMIMLK